MEACGGPALQMLWSKCSHRAHAQEAAPLRRTEERPTLWTGSPGYLGILALFELSSSGSVRKHFLSVPLGIRPSAEICRLEIEEHPLRQPDIAAEAFLFCDPATLMGNALPAFGNATFPQL